MSPATIYFTSLGVGLVGAWLSRRFWVSSIAALALALVPAIGLGLALLFKGDGC